MKRMLSSWIGDVGLFIVLLLILTVFRSGIDFFQSGHFFWLRYVKMFLENLVGISVFFLIINLIQYVFNKLRKKH